MTSRSLSLQGKGLAFNPKDFYELAYWLVNQRQDESTLRTAISRVYYSAHLIALERLVRKNWTPKGTGDDHRGVIRELRTRRFRLHGDYLYRLLELREHADYHLEASETTRNKDCSVCKEIRQSTSPAENANTRHWEEVVSISQRCLPLLEKI